MGCHDVTNILFSEGDDAVSFVKEIRKSGHPLRNYHTKNHMEEVRLPDPDSTIGITKRKNSDDDAVDCAEQNNVYECTYDTENCPRITSDIELFEDNKNPDEVQLEDDVIDLSNDNLEVDDDDDLVIVSNSDDNQGNIGRRALRRIVERE